MRLVLALAGTDHHPFDRLVEWIDAAAVRHPDARFVVQHGATRPPRVAEGCDFLSHERLGVLLAEATVVVCHGGPGLITEAREAGHVPLCVPRDPRLGEHVDGHQQRFATLVGDAGVVRTLTTAEAFRDELDRALEQGRREGAADETNLLRETARALVAAELDQLISVRPPRVGRRAPRVTL